MHLTNVAIQKHTDEYKDRAGMGSKMGLRDLKMFMVRPHTLRRVPTTRRVTPPDSAVPPQGGWGAGCVCIGVHTDMHMTAPVIIAYGDVRP